MSSIGAITCTRVIGTPPNPRQRLDIWERAGVNGFGAQRRGLGDSPFQVKAVLFSNVAGLAVWKASLEALQGSEVTITNDLGLSVSRCLLKQVGEMEVTPAVMDGGITVRGEIVLAGVVCP